MTPVPLPPHTLPTSRILPASDPVLEDWFGPVLYAGGPATLLGKDTDYPGQWCLSRPEGWEVMNDTTWCLCAPTDQIQLDPARPEVRHRIADLLDLPLWCRQGEHAEALLWWSGMTGRQVLSVLDLWKPDYRGFLRRYLFGEELHALVGAITLARHTYRQGWELAIPLHERPFGAGPLAQGPETGEAGQRASDLLAALAHDCALVFPEGLLLPPLTPDTLPVLWAPKSQAPQP